MIKLNDRLGIHLKPRNAWESMDLGVRFVQQWWRSVYAPWLLYAAILFAALHLAIPGTALLPQLVFWWLKPLHDRVLLFAMQKALLNRPATTAETLNALPALLKNGLFLNLTLFRLNPSRSFHLPVWQLEGLQGRRRRQRIKILSRGNGGRGFQLTLACLIMEWSFYLSPALILYLLLPGELDIDFEALLTNQTGLNWLDVADSISFLFAIALIEPFYVAAGFMLYINRRVQLEAWDIEWRFRRLSARHVTPVITAIILLVIVTSTPGMVPAALAAGQPSAPAESTVLLPGDRAEAVIRQVLSRDDLKTWQPDEEWTFNFGSDDKTDMDGGVDWGRWLGALLARLIRLALWLAIAALPLFLFLSRKYRPVRSNAARSGKTLPPPATVAGLPVTADSLPTDIPAAARSAFAAGQSREALSLLYRGAVLAILLQDRLPLQPYHTENDVLRIARHSLSLERIDYLQRLTRHWQAVAYGHEPPGHGEAISLSDHWSDHFDPMTASTAASESRKESGQ